MKMNPIVRGTTVNITCNVAGIDLSDYEIYFSVGPRYGKSWFSVEKERMTISFDDEKTIIGFTLTQKETLKCVPGIALAQIRAKNGMVIATDTVKIIIQDIVKDGEI